MKQRATLVVCLASVLALVPLVAGAQLSPQEDHFKVYIAPSPATFPGPVELYDQFGDYVVEMLALERFATPVEKNGEPILDPRRHQTWWSLFLPQPGREVVLENQFGPQTWIVRDARYLVLPALKNETGPLPIANHYLCYDATGPAVLQEVVLTDQFGTVTVVVADPAMFCNPVEKRLPDGTVFPIEDPFAHLACYRIDPPVAYGLNVDVQDQFFAGPLTLEEHAWLCVPTDKISAVPVQSETWGRIKALF